MRRLAPALALLGLAALGGGAAFLPLGSGAGVPTLTLRRQPFTVAVQAEGVLKAVQAAPVTLPLQAPRPSRLAWIAPDGVRVTAGEVVMRVDPTDLEKQREDAAAEVATTQLRVRRHKVESAATLENLQRDAEAARLEADMAQRFVSRDPELYSRREIIESEIDGHLARERLEHAESSRRTEAKLSQAELELMAIDRQQAQLRLSRAEEGLAALEVAAPRDGILVLERDWRGEPPRVGDTVWPGQQMAQIPDLGEMEAEVFVLEADAGALAEGRPARLIVEAHPERTWAATIRRIDKLARRRQRFSPVQYFAVTLRLEETDAESMNPGQRVRAELLLAAAEAALVVPRQAVFERGGQTVVFRRRGGGFEVVPVTLGVSGLGQVVVEEGLAEGDEIALVDPSGAPSASPREPDGASAAAATPPLGGGGR